MRRRGSPDKTEKIILITFIIILSPVIAACMIRCAGSITEAAAALSEIKIGINNGDKYAIPVISHGYGYTTDKEERSLSKPTDTGPLPYPEETGIRSGKVIEETFGEYSGDQYFELNGGGQVRNCTDVSMNVLSAQSRLEPEFKITENGPAQVLVMHTHTTESYEPFEREYYDDSFSYRSTDNTMNVVAVGDAIVKELEKNGIRTIHDITVHDYPSYTGSYDRSAETVKNILKDNPDIKVVLDIHRDAIASDGDLIAPVAEINGKKAAQVMIISGCDDGTMNMPDYLKNFRFAAALQSQLETDSPGITRPILFDYRNYNQELTAGSLLIEVGSHGNTIDQAVYSGKRIGISLAAILNKLT